MISLRPINPDKRGLTITCLLCCHVSQGERDTDDESRYKNEGVLHEQWIGWLQFDLDLLHGCLNVSFSWAFEGNWLLGDCWFTHGDHPYDRSLPFMDCPIIMPANLLRLLWLFVATRCILHRLLIGEEEWQPISGWLLSLSIWLLRAWTRYLHFLSSDFMRGESVPQVTRK